MTTRQPQPGFPSRTAERRPPPEPGLQESMAHLQRQHAAELQQHRLLSSFTSCAVPASFRARSRFLNLRDSVRKSPTKSTAKVVSSRKDVPWFSKVLQPDPTRPDPMSC